MNKGWAITITTSTSSKQRWRTRWKGKNIDDKILVVLAGEEEQQEHANWLLKMIMGSITVVLWRDGVSTI